VFAVGGRCWRSSRRHENSRGAVLRVSVVDGGGLETEVRFGVRVVAPRFEPLSLGGDREVLRSKEDESLMLLSGLSVQGGSALVDGGDDCASEELVEVSIRTDGGELSVALDAKLGVVQRHSSSDDDGAALVLRGTRASLSRLFADPPVVVSR